MIETPLGVLNVAEIAKVAHARESHNAPDLDCLVMGTADVTKDLRAYHTPCRHPMLYSLSQGIVAARAYGMVAFMKFPSLIQYEIEIVQLFSRQCFVSVFLQI